VKRFAGVRFDREFATSERADVARTLRSAGARVTSWKAAAGRTYATVQLAPHANADASASVARATVFEPPLVVLRIVPDALRRLTALEDALAGPGRPRGVRDAVREPNALVVEVDPRETPLALIVALIDRELRSAPGRTIEPLVALDDETLAAFAGHELREPGLDASRLIETHLEPLLAEASA